MQSLLERFTAAHQVLAVLGSSPWLPPLPRVRTGLTRPSSQGEALAEDAVAMLRRSGVRSVAELDTATLIRAVEANFGIDMAKAELPPGVDGATWQPDGFRIALLGCTPHWTRQRFALAHQLGHLLACDAGQLLVESHSSQERRDDCEARADVFAVNFLMPRGEICAAVPEREFTEEEFQLLAVRFLVSPRALAARLRQLGLLRPENRTPVRKLSAEHCYWVTGRIEDFRAYSVWAQTPRLPPRPAVSLYRCHLTGETTLQPLAEYAGVSPEQLHAAFAWDPRASPGAPVPPEPPSPGAVPGHPAAAGEPAADRAYQP